MTKKTHSLKRSTKGEKARNNLMLAALNVMGRVGYHRMRISDITEEAGVATGLFYHYFPDIKTLTTEVLESYIAKSLNVKEIEKSVTKGDWYERIYAHTKLVVNAYARHPGIMRCLLQLADEDASFAKILRENFIEKINWLVVQLPKLFPKTKMSDHLSIMVVYTLAGTAQTLLQHYYIDRERKIYREQQAAEEIIELLTVIFYRGLFLENPAKHKLKYTNPLLTMKKRLNS